jgi:hypothetical protein
VGEDISEQAGAIISESVGGFPRNQHSQSVSNVNALIRHEWRLPKLYTADIKLYGEQFQEIALELQAFYARWLSHASKLPL